ncbi:MAG TPA: thiopurine S-methyltransferase [Candidatus Acidoferrum sp.]|nr:thiopurine S-methyltransferase [Candidatus Acidoferrum sp.]
MEANFWHDRWTRNELGWHEQNFNPLLTGNFHRLGVSAGGRIFVPLCGKTRDIAWLLHGGYRVVGAELSELAIAQLFDDLGVRPTITDVGKLRLYQAPGLDIFVGDIFELTAPALGKVDAIYDRAALVALPAEMRIRYTRHLMEITHKAPQLLICFEYDQSQQPGPPFSVTRDEVRKHYSADYQVDVVEIKPVPGGLKGKSPADEVVAILTQASSRN